MCSIWISPIRPALFLCVWGGGGGKGGGGLPGQGGGRKCPRPITPKLFMVLE